MKIYLDTNIIYGYFLEMWKVVTGKKKEFEEPGVIKALRKGMKKCEYKVSTVTKGEIIRRLVTEFNVKAKKAHELWDSFLEWVGAEEFDHREIDWHFILNIVSHVKIKKRLSNLIHLSICKDRELIFLTGDKEILDKCKKFYPKVLSYKDFRKYLSNEKQNNNYEREQGFQNNLQENGKGLGKGKSAFKNDNHGRIQGKNVSNSQGSMGEYAKGKIIFSLTKKLCPLFAKGNNHETKGNRENNNLKRKKGKGFGSYENDFKGGVRKDNDAHIQGNGKEIKIDDDYERQGFQNSDRSGEREKDKGKGALKNHKQRRVRKIDVSLHEGSMGEVQ